MIEYKKIKKSDNELEFQLKGADHGLCAVIVEELLKDKQVEAAFYSKKHPLIGEPEFYIKTKSKGPEEVLSLALSKIEKSLKGLSV